MKQAFVNSLPKSGTNLLAKCLTLLGYRERGHISAGSVLDKQWSARARRLGWTPRGAGYLIGINTPVEVRRGAIDRRVRGLSRGQFLTAHVGYTHDLLNLSIDAGCAPVLVIRDPRAVLASSVPYLLSQPAHFLSRAFAGMGEVERYRAVVCGYYDRSVSLQPLRTCLLALDPWLRSPAVHTVRFEDIVGAGGGGSDEKQAAALTALCAKLEIEGADIGAVAERLFGPGRHTFRKGQIDSWRSELPEELTDLIREELHEILVAWGYESR